MHQKLYSIVGSLVSLCIQADNKSYWDNIFSIISTLHLSGPEVQGDVAAYIKSGQFALLMTQN